MADKVICPKCGAENFPSDAQCLSCGTRLTPARPVGPPPVTPGQTPGVPAASAVTPGPNRGAAAVSLERPNSLSVALVVCFVIAGLRLLSVGVGLAGLFWFARTAEAGKINAPLPSLGGLALFALLCLGIIVLGYFVWNGFKWARFALAALLALDIIWAAISFISHRSLLGLGAPAIFLVCLIMLLGREAGEYCVR